MNGSILFFAASLSLATAQDGRKTYQLGPDGRWQPVQQAPAQMPRPEPVPDSSDAGITDPTLLRVIELLKRRQFASARDVCLGWLKANPGAPAYDRGLYLMSQSLRGTRDYIRAFYYCDQLLDEHPESPLYQDALQLQYEIADAYLAGAKDRFLGLRILGRQDEAVEMLFRIQQRAPGSPVAEKALLRTADHYWAIGDFDLAADAYRAYTQAYARSPLVPQARLREAYANLAQFRGPAFDSTSLLNAKTLLNQIIADYPDLARQENIAQKVELADRQMARKLVLNADFYRRTGNPASAAKVCRRVIQLFPNLPETNDARKMLAKLEPHAQ